MPPPLPFVAKTGMPAEDNMSISRYMVRVDTSKRCASSDAEIFSLFNRIYIISKYLSKWKINRISRISLSALRLAVYELEFADDMPEKVSINESVELAKVYEGEETAAFVNGVLGAFIRAKQAGEQAENETEELVIMPEFTETVLDPMDIIIETQEVATEE